MARANSSNTSSRRNTSRRAGASRQPEVAAPQPSVWRWYGSGFVSGLLFALGLYLVNLPPEQEQATDTEIASAVQEEPAATGSDSDKASPAKPRFDFYTMLPEQTIDVEVDPAEVAKPRASTARTTYLLQAGSFRQREDADRRRAELLLLGLEPRIEESTTDNGRWFRVFLGPFDSHSKMSRARSLTINQDIDTLLLKRQS
ncbi:MAG: SPOR domain-containing protein [Parahaliea sp.]